MPNTNESKMPELKNCPFCNASAKPHDGDFVISHATGCFFTQQYAGEMWLTSKRRIGQWNHRTDKVGELKAGRETDMPFHTCMAKEPALVGGR